MTINYAKYSDNSSDRVRWAFRNLLHNKTHIQSATRDADYYDDQNCHSPDLAGMFTACEDAYEQATREGYAENPAVIAAVTALKSAWRTLHVANFNLTTAKGFFRVEFAAIRVDRACREAREACIKLHAAIGQAALEHRLYNRCLTLTSRHVA